jgi:sulfite reductase beta subunit-like hemoprotein
VALIAAVDRIFKAKTTLPNVKAALLKHDDHHEIILECSITGCIDGCASKRQTAS